MLTLVEAISLAGDRAKQNDDAYGFAHGRAWVLDGATDMMEQKLTRTASDAAWIAQAANASLHRAHPGSMRDAVRAASVDAAGAFAKLSATVSERWMSPISSLLMIEEAPGALSGLDLGDSRVFALGADGAVELRGGHDGVDDEVQLASRQTDADKPLLQRTATIDMLRRARATLNREGSHWTFGLDPACADHARAWEIKLPRPAHVLLMTDGFSALTDRYGAYDAGGLVHAALDKGLQDLGRELRAIENADAGGRFPRFKKSDDATAVLLRWS